MESAKSIGAILREARLAKGLSLADAEKATSIRIKYLEAVECDEYDKTPGEVFLKGMIRNYGNYLGLDGLELVNMYKASAAGMTAAVRSVGIREVDKVRLNIQLKEKRDIGSGTGCFETPKLPVKQIAAGLAAIAVLGMGYFAVPAVIEMVKNSPAAKPVQVQESSVQPAAAEAKPAVAADKVLVDMEAGGSCWLEVTADGQEIFAGMLQANDKKSFEAKNKLIVKYGNIGVMKLAVDGAPVSLQGEHGVAVKTYLRAGYQETAAYAAPAAEEVQPENKVADAVQDIQPQQEQSAEVSADDKSKAGDA